MMKFYKLLGICGVLCLMSMTLWGQVNTFPYTQHFSGSFTTGNGVFFLPNWWGSEVQSGIMGQYNGFGHGDSRSLYMMPQEEEEPTLAQVYLNLSGKENTYAGFWVATRKNGSPEDLKRVRLTVKMSTDGGLTFKYGKKIGPQMGFENANIAFEYFEYPFPPTANNKPNVVLNFEGRTGGGPHLPALLLLDAVTIDQAASDIFEPFIVGEVSPLNLNTIVINFSEPLLASAAQNIANYVFSWPEDHMGNSSVGGSYLPTIASVQLINNGYSVQINLGKPLEEGVIYKMDINDLFDLNGNGGHYGLEEVVYNIPAPGELVFSEVLFADPSGAHPMDKLQFIEIYNASDRVVPLGGLRIMGAISSHNLPNVKLNPGEFWVLTRNAEAFEQTFGFPAWEWRGSWIQYRSEHEGSDGVEPQTLYIRTTNHHKAPYVDQIFFDLGGSWSHLNREGYSMEVCNLYASNDDPGSWGLAEDYHPPYRYSFQGMNYDIYATPGYGRLPCGWTARDGSIGGVNGGVDYNPYTRLWTLNTNGYGTATDDNSQAVYTGICDDTEIVAHLQSITPTGGQAGIMIREDLSPGARMVSLSSKLTSYFYRSYRTQPDAVAITRALFRPGQTWFKIRRQGNGFYGYTSYNGSTWSFAFYLTVDMADCAKVGLFVESINYNTQTYAVFDYVQVTSNGMPVRPALVTDIEEGSANPVDNFGIYPNPSSGTVNLDMQPYSGLRGTMSVYNNLGQALFQRSTGAINPVEQLDLSTYPPGIYFVRFRIEDELFLTQKLIIERD